MTTSAGDTRRKTAPWKGRRKVADPKTKLFAIRFTPSEFEKLNGTARDAGLSVGAFSRAVLLGSPGPRAVRKPPIEKAELARLLGEVGKLGSNINQIAKAFNYKQGAPGTRELEWMKADVAALRAAIMQALGRQA